MSTIFFLFFEGNMSSIYTRPKTQTTYLKTLLDYIPVMLQLHDENCLMLYCGHFFLQISQ